MPAPIRRTHSIPMSRLIHRRSGASASALRFLMRGQSRPPECVRGGSLHYAAARPARAPPVPAKGHRGKIHGTRSSAGIGRFPCRGRELHPGPFRRRIAQRCLRLPGDCGYRGRSQIRADSSCGRDESACLLARAPLADTICWLAQFGRVGMG